LVTFKPRSVGAFFCGRIDPSKRPGPRGGLEPAGRGLPQRIPLSPMRHDRDDPEQKNAGF
jgi:hypothetical protein